MSLKRGRDKRAKAKRSFLDAWSLGLNSWETPLNGGMGSWFRRVSNQHVRPRSLFKSEKWRNKIKRIIKNINNQMRLEGTNKRIEL